MVQQQSSAMNSRGESGEIRGGGGQTKQKYGERDVRKIVSTSKLQKSLTGKPTEVNILRDSQMGVVGGYMEE